MKFQGIIPVLSCHHIQQTLEFYQQVFRYVIISKRQGADGPEWVHLKSDNSYLMLQKHSGQIPEQVTKNDKIMLYYYTDDIEDQYRFMKAKGIEIGVITTTEYGMRQYFLADPEGNRLCVGQKID